MGTRGSEMGMKWRGEEEAKRRAESPVITYLSNAESRQGVVLAAEGNTRSESL